MKQISNRQQSVSYLYYFLLGLSIAAEPFFLKLFFATYLPDFYYRALTVPISAVIGIVGLRKLQKANGDTTIKQTVVGVYQTYANLLDAEFRKSVLSRYKIDFKALFDSLKTFHSQEPTVRKHSKEARKHFYKISIFVTVCFSGVLFLFGVNFPRWGLFETSITSSYYLFLICLTSISYLPIVMKSTKQLRNAERSESDLNALLKLLSKELKGWQFERRVVLPSADSQAKGDIDVIAISPDDNYFVIELKSHIGKVTWNSELKMLYQQREKDPEPLPFNEDLLNNVNKQAKLLYKYRELSQFPDRVLIFWRAKVNIVPKKRLKRGVKISEKSRIVKDLEKRNRKLVEKNKTFVC